AAAQEKQGAWGGSGAATRERLNDFWMLRWHYERGDTRADPQFPAASALAVWWTSEYDAVCDAFVR
ncbi:hypothetical protein AB0D38_28900, partial [Streptomyces sp. NPDC048279]